MSSSRWRPLPLSVAPLIPEHEPDLSPEHKEAIVYALRWAWEKIAQREPELLAKGKEEEVTSRMQTLLNENNAMGKRCARWLSEFETVIRGESQITADRRLQKKPDLTFRPRVVYRGVFDQGRWGWFVECKIIQNDDSAKLYLNEGLARFVGGEYSAWMPSGAMVAYTRDGSTPWRELHLRLAGTLGTSQVRQGSVEDRCESDHDRSGLANPCVDITLTHLWLQASSNNLQPLAGVPPD